MDEIQERLKKIYKKWSTEDLVRAVTSDKNSYEPPAIEAMQRELKNRQLTEENILRISETLQKKEEAVSEEEALEKLYTFVAEEMKEGKEKFSIIQGLVDTGVDRTKASDIVDRIYDDIAIKTQEEQASSSSIVPAVVGGLIAAIVGGVTWGLIVIGTGHEIGFMAWGMGWLGGFAVVFFSRGKKGDLLQLIAVLSSLLGILIGKYFIFFHYLKEEIAKQYGSEAASQIQIFSEKVMMYFIANIKSFLSGYDVLWVALAVITAWRIPRGLGIKLRKQVVLQDRTNVGSKDYLTKKNIIIAFVCIVVAGSIILSLVAKRMNVEEKDAHKMDKAVQAVDERNLTTARTLLKEIIANTPKDYRNTYEDGKQVFVRVWDKDEYSHFMQETSNQDGKKVTPIPSVYPRAYYYLAYIDVEEKKFDSALTNLEQCLKLDPEQPRCLTEMALIYVQREQHEQAVSLYDRALKSHGYVSPKMKAVALRGKGVNLINLGQLDLAEKCLKESLEYEPGNELAKKELIVIAGLRSKLILSPGKVDLIRTPKAEVKTK